ncbi:MAG: hypothetical protein FJ121_09000 [Deltaproteobacteria bacterium]|nr:hypothetical protein [Deltaproteobacteria bacterium]
MSDDRIDVRVGASTGELKTGMDQAVQTVTRGVQGMQTPFDRMAQSVTGGMKQMQGSVTNSVSAISSSLGSLGKFAMGIGAILAGGALFKSSVDTYVQMNSEAKKFSVVMGMNIGDAQALLQTFKRFGVEGDTVIRAMIVMTRQLKANEGAFVANKVVTRDAGGNLLSMNEIMFNAINRLKEMKEGTERNMLATSLFGRSVSDLPGLMKMTEDAAEAMKKRLSDLGMTLDDISAAKSKAFKEGMSDVGLVADALKYKVGEELIPVLITLGSYFSKEGPQAVVTFGNSLKSILLTFELIRAGTSDLINRLSAQWAGLTAEWKGWLDVLTAATHLSWKEITEAWARGNLRVQAITQAAMANTAKIYEDALGNIEKLFAKFPGGAGKGKEDSKSDGDLFNPKEPGKGTGGSSRVQQWVQELEQIKAVEAKFQSQSLQMEKAFWAKKLATGKAATSEEKEALKAQELASAAARLKAEADYWKGKLLLASVGTKDYQEVQHKIVTLEQQQNKLRLQSEIDLIKSKIKAGEDAIKHKKDLIDHENQLNKLDIEMKQENIAHLAKMGVMSRVQELREYKKLKQQQHLEDLEAAQNKANLEKGDLRAYQKHLKDMELLKKKHALDMKKADFGITQAIKEQWGQVWESVSRAFTMSLQGIITGTVTLKDALKNIWQSILSSFVEMIAQMVLQWIAAQLVMLIFGEGADKKRAASGVGSQAAIAGAAGVASVMAAVPFPFNTILAPMVGTAAAAMAASFGVLALASAAGGWDVPHDTLAFVHKDEKILPADWPEKLRAVAAPGGGGGGGGPSHLVAKIPITVVTPDGRTILKANKTLFFDLTNQGIKRGEIRIPAPARR